MEDKHKEGSEISEIRPSQLPYQALATSDNNSPLRLCLSQIASRIAQTEARPTARVSPNLHACVLVPRCTVVELRNERLGGNERTSFSS